MGDTANFTEYIQYLYKMRDKNRFRYDKSMGDYQTWARHVREVLAPHFTLCDDGTPLYPKILRTDQMDGYRQETLKSASTDICAFGDMPSFRITARKSTRRSSSFPAMAGSITMTS